VTLRTGSFEVANSFSRSLPRLPEVKLPERGFDLAAGDTMPVQTAAKGYSPAANAGQFIRRFSYSGPAVNVRVTADAQDGAQIYSDRDYKFNDLPPALRGSDYVQAANTDKQYDAVDLMEVGLKRGSVVFLAHDDRLVRPRWLTRQFKPTDMRMTVFKYDAAASDSLTLGANSETNRVNSCNMYVVFINATSPMLAERNEQRAN
jgi:beta-galactosidase